MPMPSGMWQRSGVPQGMSSGVDGDDAAYNVYDKPLFAAKSQSLYRPGKVADDDREFEADALKRTKPARSAQFFAPTHTHACT